MLPIVKFDVLEETGFLESIFDEADDDEEFDEYDEV
jgi:hypothetical protein